jgi:STE24 endopeptidase
MNEDRSSRYHRLKRRAGILSVVWSVALLAGLLASGASVRMRDLAGSSVLALVFYVALLLLLNELGSFPIAFYSGFLLERRYGLSKEPLGRWLFDQLKSFAIGLLLSSVAAAILYALIGVSPDGWWLPAGIVFALLIVGLANLAPVLLLPLFYSVKPLDREALRARLMTLADRAGARVLGAYEWGLSEKTKKANAALAGIGATRRILVSDTMLAEYSDEEIEVVLAHELAHHVHGDIWKGIVFESMLILAGFFLAARVLVWLAPSVGLNGVADIAGLPLLVLAAGAVSFVMLPVAHAMSRAFERSADRFALSLTKNPEAFISAMKYDARTRWQNILALAGAAVPPACHERIAAVGRLGLRLPLQPWYQLGTTLIREGPAERPRSLIISSRSPSAETS